MDSSQCSSGHLQQTSLSLKRRKTSFRIIFIEINFLARPFLSLRRGAEELEALHIINLEDVASEIESPVSHNLIHNTVSFVYPLLR